MNPLVAAMTGSRISEEESAPVPAAAARPQHNARSRQARLQNRVAAAMIGVRESDGEDEESIIPDDAEPLDTVNGPSGIKMDRKELERDHEPDEPDHPVTPEEGTEEMMTPRDALVAPDVTPQSYEPIDPSEVPPPRHTGQPQQARPTQPQASNDGAPAVNPMDVLLGRATQNGTPRPKTEDDIPMTAESAQSTVNAVLNIGGMSGESALRQGTPMPDPTPAQPTKIMEAFYKYGPKFTGGFGGR